MGGQLYSFKEIVEFVALVAGAIMSVAAVVGIIFKILSKAGEPERKQNERIKEHEERLNHHDMQFREINEFLANDKRQIEEIIRGNRVTQASLLAIMDQFPEADDLRRAKKELQNYLVSK